MSRFVRQSKVRHVFCQPEKPENQYLDLRLSSATGDHNYIKANTKFFAFSVSTAGGSLAVWDDEAETIGQPKFLYFKHALIEEKY